MRLLLICAAYPPFGKGGGPVSTKLIAEGLAQSGHDVRVVRVGERKTVSKENGVQVKIVRSMNVYWDYWKPHSRLLKFAWHIVENGNPIAFFRFRAEINDFKPDLVLTISIENVNVASWFAARLCGVPVVHVAFSYFLLCWKGSCFRAGVTCERVCAGCWVSSLGKRFFSRFVDALVAESDFVLSAHTRNGLFLKATLRKIPGAVERHGDGDIGRTVENGMLTVGYIGVLTPNKGLEVLAAAAALIGRGRGIRFLIAGDGSPIFSTKIQNAFAQVDADLPGWQAPESFYPKVDLLVVPSIWGEPFGRVSVEAQSYGVPVLVARSGGLPENVIEGFNGFTYNPNDHIELANRIVNLAEDPARMAEMKTQASLYAKAFSRDLMVEQYNLLFNLLKKNKQSEAART